MNHNYTKEEKEYLVSFLNTSLDISLFHHKEHLLVTYVLLIDKEIEEVYISIKSGILNILNHVGVDTSKYHETMTYAWVLLVNFFIINCKSCNSFQEFISLNPILLDKDLLYKYYSKELIDTKEAREQIKEADIKRVEI